MCTDRHRQFEPDDTRSRMRAGAYAHSPIGADRHVDKAADTLWRPWRGVVQDLWTAL
jgi:hypothetical protein